MPVSVDVVYIQQRAIRATRKTPTNVSTLRFITNGPTVNANTTKSIESGPNDMSTSLGIPDDYSNRKYLRVVEDIIKRCAERKIPVMVHQQTIETSTKVIKLGARFVLHSSDGRMLQRIIQQEMNQLRKIAGATAKATKDTVETV